MKTFNEFVIAEKKKERSQNSQNLASWNHEEFKIENEGQAGWNNGVTRKKVHKSKKCTKFRKRKHKKKFDF